mmetsp:Transcript_74425/g.146078  ORF Transcript_74425/g.146078 Transcript_74425/m.146078 type:complete len:202 (+) Transcript_74425:1778-2383(+)
MNGLPLQGLETTDVVPLLKEDYRMNSEAARVDFPLHTLEKQSQVSWPVLDHHLYSLKIVWKYCFLVQYLYLSFETRLGVASFDQELSVHSLNRPLLHHLHDDDASSYFHCRTLIVHFLTLHFVVGTVSMEGVSFVRVFRVFSLRMTASAMLVAFCYCGRTISATFVPRTHSKFCVRTQKDMCLLNGLPAVSSTRKKTFKWS